MSTITRRVFALTALLAMSLMLTGCGESPFVGTWAMDKEATRPIIKTAMETQMASEAGEQGAAALDMMKGMIDGMLDKMLNEMDATLAVNADGTFKATGKFGDKTELTGTWTEKDGTVMFDAEGEEDDAIGTLDGDSLRFAPATLEEGMPENFALIFAKSE